MTATAASPPPSSVRVPFAALVLAMLPAVLDQTILATALPTVATDLGRLSDVSWLVTVYVVAATAATPLWGKLGDRHGRKRLLQVALAGFIGASALCGVTQDMAQLIAVRGVQGGAAGGLMTLAMAAVGDLVSPRERGRYQGYIAAVFAGATVLGPLVGGLLVEHASWRWVFYVNVPLGIAALLVLGARLPAPDAGTPRHRLDLAGAGLLVGATTALLLACVWGGDRYGWGSPEIVGLIAASGALAGALVARERRAEDPIVPLEMLRSRAVAVSSVGMFLGTAALFAVVVFVPLFLQVATGADPIEAGLLMVPMMIGTTAATNVAGRRIARTGRYRHYPAIGLALMATGLLALATLADSQSRTATGVTLVVFGVGFGLVSEVFMVAVQNAVDRRQLGTATGLTGFFRALGGSIGAAGLGAVFAAQSGTSAAGGVVGNVDPALAGEIAAAVQSVFLVAAPVAVVGALVALLLPGRELRTEAGAPSQAPPPERPEHAKAMAGAR